VPSSDSGAPTARNGTFDAADALIHEGHELEDARDIAGALAKYDAAAASSYPRAYLNKGNALRKLGRPADAVAAFYHALRLAPDYAHAHFNLGALFVALGNIKGAERELREALRLAPDMIDAPIALADAYESAGRYAEARSELERALLINSKHTGAIVNLGMLDLRECRFEEAIAAMARAKAIDPELDNLESVMLFSLNMRAELDAETVARAHRIVGAEMARAAGAPFAHWDNLPDPERRLRIGYVSGDFGFHPVGLFVDRIIAGHDRGHFDVYCYSNAKDRDSMGRRMRESPPNWREVTVMSDEQLVDLVRADGVDVLVDLSGHTNRNRLFAFARHPAPVQATWLGYLNTTGLAAIDYRICDWHTDPDALSESRHTETLYRLPNSQWCYEPWVDVALLERAHVDRPDALVFGSFNQYPKISPASIDLWSRILQRVPKATLLVLDIRDDDTRRRIVERFIRNGIDPARVTTRGRENLQTYYEIVGNTDIALDAFPYNGGTTTFDVLWMGVPLVALAGEQSISRGGVSILRTLGFPELVADSPDVYVELNVRLAEEAGWRDALRRTLRQRLLDSPLMDLPRFLTDLEAGYRWMWRQWCSGERRQDQRTARTR
jgi:predicted O-linked N-acetylglucosamine transferase (SPINDLY family)